MQTIKETDGRIQKAIIQTVLYAGLKLNLVTRVTGGENVGTGTTAGHDTITARQLVGRLFNMTRSEENAFESQIGYIMHYKSLKK